MLCWWANERKFQGLMLDYGKRFLTERPISFFYIPVFILFAIGLIALIVWQHCCFSSASASNNNFFNFSNPGFWGILNILELIWGLRFLRDACTSFFIQSTSVSLEMLLTGTGSDLPTLPAMLPTKDSSASTGVALPVDHSSTHFSQFLPSSWNSLSATLKPAAPESVTSATTHAAG